MTHLAEADTMIYWLAQATREAREQSIPPRKQVHIAAAMSRDQTTVYRFERGVAWPRDTDLHVAAYAEETGVTCFELWQRALDMWREHGVAATVEDLVDRKL